MILLSSCHTINRTTTTSDFSMFKSLGVELNRSDFIPLYKEAASWIGTPYKYGGNTHLGLIVRALLVLFIVRFMVSC